MGATEEDRAGCAERDDLGSTERSGCCRRWQTEYY